MWGSRRPMLLRLLFALSLALAPSAFSGTGVPAPPSARLPSPGGLTLASGLPVVGPSATSESQIVVRFATAADAETLYAQLQDVEGVRLRLTEQLDTLTLEFAVGERDTVRTLVEAALATHGLAGSALVEDVPVARALPVVPNDPFWSQQWGIPKIGVDDFWTRTTGSSAVVVAVVDTGVNVVSELSGRVLPGWDFVDDDADPADDNGHGTMSATVIAAAGDNLSGVAGVCWSCTILPVRALGTDGTGTYADIAAAIVYAADQGADIINLSLGGDAASQTLDDAVAYARQAGALVIASAGNDGVTNELFPAASPGALAVAGSDQSDLRYSWSNYGTWVDVAAPGCNPAQDETGSYVWYCGTSSAAPAVSGLAALALSDAPDLSDVDLFDLLTGSAVAVDFTASGRVDANGLAALLDAPPPDVTSPVAVFLTPGPSAHLAGETTFTFSASDDVGVVAVELWDGDDMLGAADLDTSSLTVDTSTMADGSRVLRWRAYDAAGNVGVVQRTFVVDNTAPSLLFAAPQHATSHSGWVEVTPNVTDANLRRVDLWVEGSPTAIAWQPPYASVFDSRLFPDGPVELRFRAHDRAGNVSVVSRQVLVANTPPDAAVGWPNPGRIIRGTVGVRPSVTSVSPVASTILLVDGVPAGEWPYLPQIASWDSTLVADGQVNLELQVTDQAGNVSWSPVRVVTADNTAPQIVVTDPNPGGVIVRGQEVVAEVTDVSGISRVQLWVGGLLVAEQLDPETAAVRLLLPEDLDESGLLLLRVVAFDSVGNRAMLGRVADVR